MFKIRIFFSLLVLITSCRTVSDSNLNYSKHTVSLDNVTKNTCEKFVRKDGCYLRLIGYSLTPALMDTFSANDKRLIKILRSNLKDFGNIDLTSSSNPRISEINDNINKYQLNEIEYLSLLNYTAYEYKEMNRWLRGDKGANNRVEDTVYGAASALNHLKELSYQGLVYRSEFIDADKWDEVSKIYSVDAIVFEPTFLSTTTNELLRFGEKRSSQRTILRYVITSKSGVDISGISMEAREKEVLFTPGSIFKVISVDREKMKAGGREDADVVSIHMEEIVLTATE